MYLNTLFSFLICVILFFPTLNEKKQNNSDNPYF
eukprot:UN10262